MFSKPIQKFLLATFTLGWLLQMGSRYANTQGWDGLFTLLLLATAVTPGACALIFTSHRPALIRQMHWRPPQVVAIYAAAFAFGALWLLAALLVCQSPLIHWNGAALLPLFIIFALAEEIGWRGYLLPHLLRHTTPSKATVWVGVFWGFWHLIDYIRLPLGLWSGMFATMLALAVVQSFFYTWLHLHTRRLWTIAVAHGSSNLFASMVLSGGYELAFLPTDLAVRTAAVGIYTLCAVLLIVADRKLKVFLGQGDTITRA